MFPSTTMRSRLRGFTAPVSETLNPFHREREAVHELLSTFDEDLDDDTADGVTEAAPSRCQESSSSDRPSTKRMSEDLQEYLQDNAENLLACLYLVDPGNRATIKLLMRGMPVPCTFGFPGTNGTVWSNYREFVKQFHPSISIKGAHPLHPFTRKERLVVFLCTVAFNALWSAFTEYQREKMEATFKDYEDNQKEQRLTFLFVKHIATVIYAVVIRQLVICPCAYNALVDDIVNNVEDEESLADMPLDKKLQDRARRLMTIKIVGDRVLLWLFVVHCVVVTAVIIWISSWHFNSDSEDNIDDFRSPSNALSSMAQSELLNFFFWFVKFFPLFVGLYPIHRAQWYVGGDVQEYLLCQRGNPFTCYRTSENFLNPEFPRRVEPETVKCSSAKMKTLVTDVFNFRRSMGGYHLSTFRRRGEFEFVNHSTRRSASFQHFDGVTTSQPGGFRSPASSPDLMHHVDDETDVVVDRGSRGFETIAKASSKLVPLRLASYLSSSLGGRRDVTRADSTSSLSDMLSHHQKEQLARESESYDDDDPPHDKDDDDDGRREKSFSMDTTEEEKHCTDPEDDPPNDPSNADLV